MINGRLFEYQCAKVYESANIRNQLGVNQESYVFLKEILVSRLEPISGTGFELKERGEIIQGRYKVFTLIPLQVGMFLYIVDKLYRIDVQPVWNYVYYEIQLQLLEGETIG